MFVTYRDLVRNPEGQVRHLYRFLGLDPKQQQPVRERHLPSWEGPRQTARGTARQTTPTAGGGTIAWRERGSGTPLSGDTSGTPQLSPSEITTVS